jgi:hypothetical protein
MIPVFPSCYLLCAYQRVLDPASWRPSLLLMCVVIAYPSLYLSNAYEENHASLIGVDAVLAALLPMA